MPVATVNLTQTYKKTNKISEIPFSMSRAESNFFKTHSGNLKSSSPYELVKTSASPERKFVKHAEFNVFPDSTAKNEDIIDKILSSS